MSSEANFDFAKFYLDGNLLAQTSGEVDWQNYPFALTAGTHTLEWRYTKDATGSTGLDASFIDNVQLPLVIATNATSPAHLELLRLFDDSLLLQVQGQTNQQYVIQGTPSLTPPVTWQNLSTNIANGGLIYFSDPGTANNLIRFYRAIVP